MQDFLARFMPLDASEHGAALDRLNATVHWLMLILFVVWAAYFVFVLMRFRASRNGKVSYHGARTHASTYGEAAVAVVEVILLVGFSIPAWKRWATPLKASENPAEIRIVAEQFAWNVHYPGRDGQFGHTDVKLVSSTNPLGLDPNDPKGKDDITTLNQLHLEVGRPVMVRITSKDVIHSFFLPVMRVKQDAIPGMEIPIHFKPVMSDDGRKWEIACAQLCGLGHYRMRGELHVHSRADYQKWLASMAPENPATPAPNPVPAATPALPAATQPGSEVATPTTGT